jgi:hypothetical protein
VVAVATISNVRIAGFPARPAHGANRVPQPGRKRTRWAGPVPWAAPLLGAAGCLLAAWTGYLAVSLPERSIRWHYNIAWAGFDVLLLVLVLGTAWLTYRRSPHAAATAAATAALLVADAWFDVTTSASGRPLRAAILLAVLVELPAAAFMICTSRRSLKAKPPATTDQAPAASPARPQPDRDFMLTAAVTTAHARIRRSLAPGRPLAPDDSLSKRQPPGRRE